MRLPASVLLLPLLSSAALAADWPAYRADAARSGYTAEALPDSPQPAWTYRAAHAPMPAWPTRTRLRYDVVYQPVVAGGLVYFGSSADGKVYALDASTGRLRWQFFTDAPVRFAPAYADGRLFVASDDGYLYGLNAADGSLAWKLHPGPRPDLVLGNDRLISRWPARGGPVVADGVVYFGAGIWPSEGIYLCAVDPATGRVLWCNDSSGSLEMNQPHPTAHAKSGIAVQGYLAVQGDSLLVPTGRAVPAVFDRASGQLRYFNLQGNGHDGGSDVVAVDGQFFNDTSVFDLASGDPRGRAGVAVAAHPQFVLASDVNRFEALNRRDLFTEKWTTGRKGEKKRAKALAPPVWTLDLPEEFALAPLLAKGAELPDWKLMGSTNYSKPSISGQPGSLVVAGDRAILGGRDQVIAVDLSSHAIAWQAKVDGNACGLAVADGRLYVSTDRGIIHCFSAYSTPHDPSPPPPLAQGERGALGRTVAEAAPQPSYAAAAEAILARTGVTAGTCVDLACGDGRLALELARRSHLTIYGMEKDPAQIRAARELLDRAGLYGTRVVIHEGDPAKVPYPDYFADLVVSGRSISEGAAAAPASWYERIQHPYGGVACLGKPEALQVSVRGAVPGAGEWTHQNTDPANSFCSPDTAVHGPLEMLWFRDTDLVMSNRHGRPPAPLVAEGRMYVEGLHALRAVDLYNGRTLWECPLENVLLTYHREHSIGAAWAGSNFCYSGGSLYVHTGKQCLRLDAKTGRRTAEYPVPSLPGGKPGTWAYIACDGQALYGSLADEDYLVRCWSADWDTSGQFIESKMLFALDPGSGKVLWTYVPKDSIRNNAIAVADGRVYLIDRPVADADHLRYPIDQIEAVAKRRAASAGTSEKDELRRITEQPTGRLVALESRSGKPVWSSDEEIFGTQLAVSQAHGILLMSYQPAHQATLVSERGDRMAAFRAADGTRLWDAKAKYVARPILNDRTIYAEPGAWDLLTGKELPFRMERSYGCGIPCASRNLLLFRSATLGYIDLASRAGVPPAINHAADVSPAVDSDPAAPPAVENYGGIRPGCWFNAIPAGGLVLMADSASWCTCSYLNQATVALKPISGR